MLKVVGEVSGRKFVAVGLSRQDLDGLRGNRPVFVRGQDLGLDLDVMIWSGKDEDSMREELRRYFPNLEERQGA